MATRRTAKKTAASAKKESMLLAVVGSAEISQESFDALLNDYTEGKDVALLLPITKDHWTEAVEAAVSWAKDEGVAYDAIVDDTTKGRGIKGAADNASSTEKSTDVVSTLVKIIGDAEEDTAAILIAWDEDDDLTYSVLEAADEAGVTCFNLADALEPLSFDDDGSGGDDETGDDSGADDGTVGGHTREEVGEWPLRKIRSWALDKDIHGKNVLTSDKTSEMGKPELLDHFFGEEEGGSDPEPEKPARGRGRGSRSRAAEEPQDEPEPGGEGDDDPTQDLPADEAQALAVFLPKIDRWVSDAEALQALKTLQKYVAQGDGNPPGRPRKDGAPAGTRSRRSRRSDSNE